MPMTETNRHALDEMLILVDGEDNVLGHESKEKCHDGEGLLHRAFSVFIFNAGFELLIQRRSAQKRLWPLFWSNSVCSHPRKGEHCDGAARRRLREELGMEAPLRYLFKFQYRAPFMNAGSENEICSVYVGRTDGVVKANEDEISEWQYIGLEELDRRISRQPGLFTPWFKMEWERIRLHHLTEIKTI